MTTATTTTTGTCMRQLERQFSFARQAVAITVSAAGNVVPSFCFKKNSRFKMM